LGEHPDGGEVQVMPGRYGPYVKWEKVNATLPKDVAPEAVTLEEALVLIAEKAGKGGKKKSPAKKAAGTGVVRRPFGTRGDERTGRFACGIPGQLYRRHDLDGGCHGGPGAEQRGPESG
jgi:hypothetical protein